MTDGGFVRQRPQEYEWYTSFIKTVRLEQIAQKAAIKNVTYRRSGNLAIWSKLKRSSINCNFHASIEKGMLNIYTRCALSPSSPSHSCMNVSGYGKITFVYCKKFGKMVSNMKTIMHVFSAPHTPEGTRDVIIFAIIAFLMLRDP